MPLRTRPGCGAHPESRRSPNGAPPMPQSGSQQTGSQPSDPQDDAPGHRVHKFGGSSLADAVRIRALPWLLDEDAGPRLVVVSAMQGVTDALVELGRLAQSGLDWQAPWQTLRERHLRTADELGAGAALAA